MGRSGPSIHAPRAAGAAAGAHAPVTLAVTRVSIYLVSARGCVRGRPLAARFTHSCGAEEPPCRVARATGASVAISPALDSVLGPMT